MKAKRNYRDSLFRSIFNNKKNLLSLYNALEGTDYTDAKEIRITTLRGTFFNDLKNDISFQIVERWLCQRSRWKFRYFVHAARFSTS